MNTFFIGPSSVHVKQPMREYLSNTFFRSGHSSGRCQVDWIGPKISQHRDEERFSETLHPVWTLMLASVY